MGHRLGLLSMIDSWEMESLPKLTVRSGAAGLMLAWCAGRRWELVRSRLRRNARSSAWRRDFCSQAREGMWGMPGHTEAMKAVVSCEKLGGVAHTR